MRRRRVAILDLLEKGPTNSLWARAMQPNFASIMPQVIGVWCEQAGHDVTLVCYTGREDLARELPDDAEVVFIASYTASTFTPSATTAGRPWLAAHSVRLRDGCRVASGDCTE